jgi:hypothetical protein
LVYVKVFGKVVLMVAKMVNQKVVVMDLLMVEKMASK